MNAIKRFFGHLHTVNKHRRVVRHYCFKCGLVKQGLIHDLSKYSRVEFWNGVKFFTGTKSPHYGERKDYGYSLAWMHHKGRNKHHMDYWTDISLETGKTEPVIMPWNYFVEMICDRIAAARIYGGKNYDQGAPLDYFLKTRHENVCHELVDKYIKVFLTILKTDGEKAMFKILKDSLKQWKKYKVKSWYPSLYENGSCQNAGTVMYKKGEFKNVSK